MMTDNIRKVYFLLTASERKKGVMVLLLMLFVAVLQMGAVSSLIPFMAAVTNPEVIESNRQFAWLYEQTGFEQNGFLIFLGCIVLASVIVSNVAGASMIWVSSRFIWDINLRLSRDLLRNYLNRSYLWFTQQGSANPGKNILGEVQYFTKNFMKPLAELIAKGATTISLLAVIVLVDWKVALVATVFVGGSYGAIYLFIRKRLSEIGKKRTLANGQRFKAVQEAFGAFKETKVFQCEPYFTNAYEKPTKRVSRFMVLEGLVKGLPRHILEVLAFGGLVILVLYFLFRLEDFRQFIPILSVYAFAGYKLMPALQGCFASLTSLRFSQYVVSILYDDCQETGARPNSANVRSRAIQAKLPFRREIRFEDVTFSYPTSERPVISGLSLSIRYNTMVAFCGATGSGKTTIVDLLLGVLPLEKGQILIDDIALSDENLAQWRQNIGYVPQHIFLADDTITHNIAFGVPEKEIDLAAVRKAAEAAQIDEYISEELPNEYETVVGERGIRLSGGQRQRLGIARALYHDPDVLIFDEATSALDGMTEEQVMEAIRTAGKAKTVIMIAHRLSTVRECDQIFLVRKGQVIERGSYQQLLDLNGTFHSMVKAI